MSGQRAHQRMQVPARQIHALRPHRRIQCGELQAQPFGVGCHDAGLGLRDAVQAFTADTPRLTRPRTCLAGAIASRKPVASRIAARVARRGFPEALNVR